MVSYDHAYALVRAYGEAGWTARLVPLTVDGLIYASSMVLLQSAQRRTPIPRLARWLLGLGIAATLAANATHGLNHGPVGAIVAAWPAVALVGTYELLMTVVRCAGRVSRALLDTESVPAAVPEGDLLQVQAADAFAEDLAAGRIPTVRAIRFRLGQPPRPTSTRISLDSRCRWLGSRMIVGWKAATSMRTELVLDTIEMACWNRGRTGVTDLG